VDFNNIGEDGPLCTRSDMIKRILVPATLTATRPRQEVPEN